MGQPDGAAVDARESRRNLAAAVALFVGLLTAYNAAPAEFQGNDTTPAVYAAVSLARRADFDLDEFAGQLKGNRAEWPYFVAPTLDGRVVSRYGIGAPLAVQPVFAPVLALERRIPNHVAMVLARVAASLYVAGAAVLLLLSAMRLGASRRTALLLALVYGLGTSALSSASQALWQHGPAQFFLMLGFHALLGDGRRDWLAGAAFAAAVLCRPLDGLFGAAAFVYLVVQRPRQARRWLGFAAGAAPLLLVQLVFNQIEFGAPWLFGQVVDIKGRDGFPVGSYWIGNIGTGLAGLLVSPSRGLFVYSPVFLFLFLGLRRNWAAWPGVLRAMLAATVVMFAVVASWYAWYGGWCFGYRIVSDAAPFLVLALLPVLPRLRRFGRMAFGAALAMSIAIHAAGAYNYSPGDWDLRVRAGFETRPLWSLTDSQLVHVFTHRRQHTPP